MYVTAAWATVAIDDATGKENRKTPVDRAMEVHGRRVERGLFHDGGVADRQGRADHRHLLFVTALVDVAYVAGWVFAALRVLHCAINRVMLRLGL